jgi:cytochrome c biogenesis protein CcmG/thiol:disulfide interchange protein DsbE
MAALLAGAVVIAYNRPAKPEAAASAVGNRQAAPDFTLRDIQGSDLRLSAYKGSVVLLNFWATWCPPCKIEIPWFSEFHQKYRDRGLVVVGVAMDEEGWEAIRPYVEERKIRYRIAAGTDEVARLYGGVESLPTTLLIDREGKIAALHTGLVSKSTYEGEILDLLGK